MLMNITKKGFFDYTIDYQSLAIYRVFLALVLFVDWLTRIINYDVFFAEHSVLPQHQLKSFLAPVWGFYADILSIVDYPWLLTLHFFLIVLFAFGAFSRITPIALWFVYLLLRTRNPLVMSEDKFMAICLFWTMFLPVGKYYSFDAWKKHRFYSFADRGFNNVLGFAFFAFSIPASFCSFSALSSLAIYLSG